MAGSAFVTARTNAYTKSVALQDLPETAWKSIVGTPLDESISPAEVYQRVPWIYRAVMLRAHTLADIPYVVLRNGNELWSSEEHDQTPPKGFDWLDDIYDLLMQTEMAICVEAKAFWFRRRNRIRTLGFQWLQPKSVTPIFDEDEGLQGFDRKYGNQVKRLTTDDIVYWWLPSVAAEVGPGISPVRACIQAAGLLKGIDDFGRGYFDRGAINTTLLSVDGNPPPEELGRLEKWWKRLVSGVRRAHETIAIRAGITPVVVGSPPKDMALETLTNAKRLDVSVGLGVPQSLLEDQASNYAQMRESIWSFLNFTILPEAEMVERGLNKQVFYPMGMEFRFKPEQLQIVMERRMDNAVKSLLPAVVEGVVTPNEMRMSLGFEAIDGQDELRTPAPAQLAPSGETITFPDGAGNGSGQQVTDEDAQLADSKSVKALPKPRRTVKRVQRDETGRISAVIEDVIPE